MVKDQNFTRLFTHQFHAKKPSKTYDGPSNVFDKNVFSLTVSFLEVAKDQVICPLALPGREGRMVPAPPPLVFFFRDCSEGGIDRELQFGMADL